VSIQACAVSFDHGTEVQHCAEVNAESVFEAAALALHVFEDAGTPPGPATHLEIAAHVPIVSHSIVVQRARGWLRANRQMSAAARLLVADYSVGNCQRSCDLQ
jgi:hypothetical protein